MKIGKLKLPFNGQYKLGSKDKAIASVPYKILTDLCWDMNPWDLYVFPSGWCFGLTEFNKFVWIGKRPFICDIEYFEQYPLLKNVQPLSNRTTDFSGSAMVHHIITRSISINFHEYPFSESDYPEIEKGMLEAKCLSKGARLKLAMWFTHPQLVPEKHTYGDLMNMYAKFNSEISIEQAATLHNRFYNFIVNDTLLKKYAKTKNAIKSKKLEVVKQASLL